LSENKYVEKITKQVKKITGKIKAIKLEITGRVFRVIKRYYYNFVILPEP